MVKNTKSGFLQKFDAPDWNLSVELVQTLWNAKSLWLFLQETYFLLKPISSRLREPSCESYIKWSKTQKKSRFLTYVWCFREKSLVRIGTNPMEFWKFITFSTGNIFLVKTHLFRLWERSCPSYAKHDQKPQKSIFNLFVLQIEICQTLWNSMEILKVFVAKVLLNYPWK